MSISPAPPYLVEYLQYYHRGLKIVNYRRVNDFEKRLLHQSQPDGSILTFPGFYTAACKLIQENNDSVVTVDRRTPLPAVDWKAIQGINWAGIGSTGLRAYQLEPIAEFLTKAQDTSGIINSTGGTGKTIIQVVTYAAFNSLNTILAVPLKEVFLQTYDKFRRLLPDKHIGRVGGGFHEPSTDITIATFRSLPSCSIEKCQLLLIDELQSTTGEEISSIICKMQPRRIFGYTATDQGMFNKAEKLIKGFFGERLIYIPYEDAEKSGAVVPIKVYFLKIPDNVMVTAGTIEGKMNQGIKQCKVRNQLIGEVCKLVPKDWQTLVFIEHIKQHLIPLSKELPLGTAYIHRESSKDKIGAFALTAKQQKQVINRIKNNEVQFICSTDLLKAGFDAVNLRVLIQASGGSSEVEILQEAYRISRTLSEHTRLELGAEKKTHGVLIDFEDNHDPALHSMAQKRKEMYAKQGWKIHCIDDPKEIVWTLQ